MIISFQSVFENLQRKTNIQTNLAKINTKPQFKIGNWQLPSGDVLAPMAGLTDSPFRRLTRKLGSGLLYSEVVSAEGIRREGKKSFDLCIFHEEERPIAIQLFGSEPQQFADAAAVIEERIKPDMIDINCGCPVRRFVKRGSGGFLMSDPELIGRIVEAVKKSANLPVSVKLRTGFQRPDVTALDATRAANEAGASLIAIHGRFVKDGFKPPAVWDIIGRIKEIAENVPVIGNGDVFSYADAKRMVDETGCDRVMIGRWARGKPWVYKATQYGYQDDQLLEEPSSGEILDILLEHYRLMLEFYTFTPTAVTRMRKFIVWYTKGMNGASALRKELMTEPDPVKVQSRLWKFKEEIIEWEKENLPEQE